MTSAFDVAGLERALREDLAALRETGAWSERAPERAFSAFENAGLLRRLGRVPADCERVLAEEEVIAAALRFLETTSLDEEIEALLRPARAGDARAGGGGSAARGGPGGGRAEAREGEAAEAREAREAGEEASEEEKDGEDELSRLSSPEAVERAERLFLRRDRLQAGLGEIARNLPPRPDRRRGELGECGARASVFEERLSHGRSIADAPLTRDEPLRRPLGLAGAVARLARLDARMRAHIEVLYPAIPLIRDLKRRFDWERLDPAAYWWWREIEGSFQALEEASSAEALVRAGLEEQGRRCAEDIEDVDEKRAAFALGETFPGRAAFGMHLARCAACREIVTEFERLLREGRASQHGAGAAASVVRWADAGDEAEIRLRLAAEPAGDPEFEALRAATYRPPAAIPGTELAVAIGLRERDRMRFTFTFASPRGGPVGRALDGAAVRVEGIGSAPVKEGAAEIALPSDRPLPEVVAEAFRARRALFLPDGRTIELP